MKYFIENLYDGTKFVKIDGRLFAGENGETLSQKQAYQKLVGKVLKTEDGDSILVTKRIGTKDIYNELVRRYPNIGKLSSEQLKKFAKN